MEPARTIISKLGGVAVVSDLVGIHRTRVSNWRRPRTKGGTNGLIPQDYHLRLIDFAATKGVTLTGDDFLPIRSSENTNIAPTSATPAPALDRVAS
jgi:hypothetical protein